MFHVEHSNPTGPICFTWNIPTRPAPYVSRGTLDTLQSMPTGKIEHAGKLKIENTESIKMNKSALTLAISNQKGGVGKTTTAVNLAACLAAAERKVLLIDLDPQGNATSALGLDGRAMAPSSYELLVDECNILDCVRKTELHYLDVIVANQELTGAEIELVTEMGREHRLKRAIENISLSYDYIIIDCPPALGLLTLNALVAADRVFIPLQTEYFALEGLSQLIKTVDLVKKVLNSALKIEGILLTMFDRRNNLSHQVENDVRSHFGPLVYNSRIPRNVKLGEAPSFGKPIILYDIACPAAVAYMQTAQELIHRQKAALRLSATADTGTELDNNHDDGHEIHPN